jgi:cytochrome c-type biogenesis protein CcmE
MSKDLDQELEHALKVSDDVAEQAVTKPVTPRPAPPKSKGNLALLLVLVALAGGVVVLFLVGFKEAAIYAMPAHQAVAQASDLKGRKLRVDGELVPGSLMKRDKPCEYRFKIQSKGTEMPVQFPQCVIPDTFRDQPEGGVEVTVEGEIQADGAFTATLVMAKCASKYDPATHEMVMPDGSRVKATSTGSPRPTDGEPIR